MKAKSYRFQMVIVGILACVLPSLKAAQNAAGATGADYIQGYSAFAARHRFLKLLPLYWYTLYRVERSATIRS